MNKRYLGLVFTILLFLALVLLNRRDVKLEIETPEINPIGISGYELRMFHTFENSNLLSSTIVSIEEDVFVKGLSTGKVSLQPEQGIPGLKKTTLLVMLRFPKDNIDMSAYDQEQKVRVDVNGTIVYRNLTGGGVIEVNFSDSVKVKYLQ